jgi:uncharacterized protein YwgA
MRLEEFHWLAAVVAAHPSRQVVGRTRLQKTVRLLQRLGFPTHYGYTLFFYGPYSEGVHADLRLLQGLGLIAEEERTAQDGDTYYIIHAKPAAERPEIRPWQPRIDAMSNASAVVLELAATYDTFRDLGSDHREALASLRRKKGSKCDGGNQEAALSLLKKVGLPANGTAKS